MLLDTTVVRMRLVGWLVDILQWLKALSHVRCVSIGPPAAVNGLVTSGSATVVLSMFTGCHQHPPATCVTVETVAASVQVELLIFYLIAKLIKFKLLF